VSLSNNSTQVLQGSVQALFSWGEKCLHDFAGNLFRKLQTKFRLNHPSFVEDITKKTFWFLFSWTQCIMHYPTNSIMWQPPRTHNASTHQISTQANNPWRSCCDLNMSNLGAIRHLEFDQKWIFIIPWHLRTMLRHSTKNSTKFGNASMRRNSHLIFLRDGSELHQTMRRHCRYKLSVLSQFFLNFTYIGPFSKRRQAIQRVLEPKI